MRIHMYVHNKCRKHHVHGVCVNRWYNIGDRIVMGMRRRVVLMGVHVRGVCVSMVVLSDRIVMGMQQRHVVLFTRVSREDEGGGTCVC